MRFTRRYLGEVGLGAVLLGAAALTGRPEPLVGAAGVVGGVLGGGLAFRREATRTLADLEMSQAPVQSRSVAGAAVTVRFAATLPRPASVDLRMTAAVPVGADAPGRAGRTLELPAGETTAETTFDLRWTVAGDHPLGGVTVTVADRAGRFAESIPYRSDTTVQVQASGVRDVVEGGAIDLRSTFERESDVVAAAGTDIAGVRRYLPTDQFSRIDWKATARLNELYVRETVAESDPVTALFVDHRAATGARSPSGSELDYFRDAALAVERRARETHRPLALCTVGDEGITKNLPAARTADGYAAVRRVLGRLEPTPSRVEAGGGGVLPRGASPDDRRGEFLAGEATDFARTLRPFLDRGPTYVRRVADDPLSRAMRASLAMLGENVQVVVCTDDRNPSELYEAVQAARTAGAEVTLLIAHAASFEAFPGTTEAYNRIVANETLRRRLGRMRGVRVVEVGPSAAVRAESTRPPRVETPEVEA